MDMTNKFLDIRVKLKKKSVNYSKKLSCQSIKTLSDVWLGIVKVKNAKLLKKDM